MSTSHSSPNLSEIHDHLHSLALQAGEMITSAHPTSSASSTKLNSADLVTETDAAVEKFISTSLSETYPDYSFMGEETYKPGTKLASAPTFIVDPIDGTTNFVHRYPYVSISLGFAVDKQPVVGVVFNPFTGKLYSAIKGHGAYLEDVHSQTRQKLPLRNPPEPMQSLSGCLVAVEWGSDRTGSNWRVKTETWAKLGASKEEGGAMVHSARCLGSAALNMCAVAEGSLDLYWEGGCWAWDVCAGWVVLTEAGGVVVDGNPSGKWEVPVDHRKYLAVRMGEGQKGIVEEFWGFVTGDMKYEH